MGPGALQRCAGKDEGRGTVKANPGKDPALGEKDLRSLDWRGLFCQSVLRILLCAAILPSVLSCAPIGPRMPTVSTIPEARLDPGYLVRKLVQRDQQLRSLRTLATVDYRSWSGRGRFQEAVLVHRPNRLGLGTLSP